MHYRDCGSVPVKTACSGVSPRAQRSEDYVKVPELDSLVPNGT